MASNLFLTRMLVEPDMVGFGGVPGFESVSKHAMQLLLYADEKKLIR
jgi:hypothetical protein